MGGRAPALSEGSSASRGEAPFAGTLDGMEATFTVSETRPPEQESPDGEAPKVAPTWNPRRDPLVWAILAVYLALAIASSFIHELGYAADETSRHLPYVEWLYH